MRTSPKKWERLSAVILTFALLLSILPATAMAISTGDKSIDNEVHYQVNGAIDAGVRYCLSACDTVWLWSNDHSGDRPSGAWH